MAESKISRVRCIAKEISITIPANANVGSGSISVPNADDYLWTCTQMQFTTGNQYYQGVVVIAATANTTSVNVTVDRSIRGSDSSSLTVKCAIIGVLNE